MSFERIIEALISFGLSRVDAEVYVFLTKKGPQKAIDLARTLKINKKKIFSSLKILQTKGLVTEDLSIFSALPFEETLELLIKEKKKQTETMQKIKKELAI